MSWTLRIAAALAVSLCATPSFAQNTLDAKLREIAEPLVDEIIALVCDSDARIEGNQIFAEADADAFWGILRQVIDGTDAWETTLLELGDRPDPPIYRYPLGEGEDGQSTYVNVLDFTDGRLPATRERSFTLNVPTANVSEWINGRRGNEQVPGLGEITFDDNSADGIYDAAMVRRAGEWFLVVWRPKGQNSICLPDLGTETALIASLLVDKNLVSRIAGDGIEALETALTFPLQFTFPDGGTATLDFSLTQGQLAPYLNLSDFLDVETRASKFALAILDVRLQAPLSLRDIASTHSVLLTPDGPPVEMWTYVMIDLPTVPEDSPSYRIFVQLPTDDLGDDAVDPEVIENAIQQGLAERESDAPSEPAPAMQRYETIKVDFVISIFGEKNPVAENLIVDRCDAILYENGIKIGELTLRETDAENERLLVLTPASIAVDLPQIGEVLTENLTITLRTTADNTDNQPCSLAEKSFELTLRDTFDGAQTPFVLYQAKLPHPDPSVVLAMSFPVQGDVGESLSTGQIRKYGYLLTQIARGLETVYRPLDDWQHLTGYFGAFTLNNGTRFIRLGQSTDQAFSAITKENWSNASSEFERDRFTLDRPTRGAFLREAANSLLESGEIAHTPQREVIFVNYRKTFDAGTGQNPCQSNQPIDASNVKLIQIIIMFELLAFQPDFDIRAVPYDGSGVYRCADTVLEGELREDLILIDVAAVLQDEQHNQLPDIIRQILNP